MPGFTRSIVIDRPVAEVFDFATDLNNASLFMPNVTKCEWVTDGGTRTGAKFRETRRMNGKERSAVIEVIEHDPPSVHAAKAAMMGMSGTYRFRFTPQGQGTRVDLDADVKGMFLWKPFLGMMSRMMEKEDGEYLTRLKEAMEKQPQHT
jgi:hypothetical protein